jgi:hypothetical protein
MAKVKYIVLFMLMLLWTLPVHAVPDTSYASVIGASAFWLDSSYALGVVDALYTTCDATCGALDGYLVCTSYGAGIPTAALSIDSMRIQIRGTRGASGETGTIYVRLVRNGAYSTDSVAVTLPTLASAVQSAVVGTNGLGGFTWTVSQCNSVTSGVRVIRHTWASEGTASIDYVRWLIMYTMPGGHRRRSEIIMGNGE